MHDLEPSMQRQLPIARAELRRVAAWILMLGGALTGAEAAQDFPPAINVSILNGSNGFRVDGATTGGRSGYSVSAAGDINDDGFDDLIIGAPSADPGGNNNAGSSYILFGVGVADVVFADLFEPTP